jgi:FxsC-like protein
MPLFFLSYAHLDDRDRWVREFYADLCNELIGKAGVGKDAIGFQDLDMPSGTRWSDELAEMLATCRIFVAMYSPSYFHSEACGKEWHAFTDRLAAAAGPDGLIPPLVVPILWEPIQTIRMPDAAGLVQHRDPSADFDLGGNPARARAVYARYGMRVIVRNRKQFSLLYQHIFASFAIEIANATRDHPLAPAPRPRWEHTPDAFAEPAPRPAPGPTPGREPAPAPLADILEAASPTDWFDADDQDPAVELLPAQRPAPPPGGARVRPGQTRVRLVVAAGTAAERSRPTDPAGYYGPRPAAWSPFAPHDPTPLVHAAAVITLAQDMTPSLEELDDSLPALLAAAERDNDLVVLLVDPRSAAAGDVAAALRPYDDRLDLNSGLVAVWNAADLGSAELRTALRLTLPKRSRRRDPSYQGPVLGAEEFRRSLITVLVFLQRLLFDSDEPDRAGSLPAAGPLATVQGPVRA